MIGLAVAKLVRVAVVPLRVLLAGGALAGAHVLAEQDLQLSYGAIEEPPRPAAARRFFFDADAADQCYLEGSASVGSSTARFGFLLDSGSYTVALGLQHAIALGIDPAQLVFDHRISTANGVGWAAQVRIDELRIAGMVFRNVTADIDKGGLETPLLGAPLLKRLSFQYANGSCAVTVPQQQSARLDAR